MKYWEVDRQKKCGKRDDIYVFHNFILFFAFDMSSFLYFFLLDIYFLLPTCLKEYLKVKKNRSKKNIKNGIILF